MRIQWNSEAAREVLERLRRAQQELEDEGRRAGIVRRSLDEANPEGDNKALNALAERFEACSRRMDALAQEIESFNSALIRTETAFDDAERSNKMLIDALEPPPGPIGTGRPVYAAINWEPGAYTEMRETRLHAAPVPEWLLHRL